MLCITTFKSIQNATSILITSTWKCDGMKHSENPYNLFKHIICRQLPHSQNKSMISDYQLMIPASDYSTLSIMICKIQTHKRLKNREKNADFNSSIQNMPNVSGQTPFSKHQRDRWMTTNENCLSRFASWCWYVWKSSRAFLQPFQTYLCPGVSILEGVSHTNLQHFDHHNNTMTDIWF